MKHRPGKAIRRGGIGAFTVTEMVVVIGVTAILLTLLLSSVAKVKHGGLEAKCVSNLRQLGIALLNYSGDNHGMIPPRVGPDPAAPGMYLPGTFWHQVLRQKGYMQVASTKSSPREGGHYCPLIPFSGSSDEAYGMRRWKTPGQAMDVTQNLLRLEQPSDFFLLVDSYVTSANKQGYFVYGGTSNRIRFGQGGRANTLFADGHVAPMDRAYFDGVPLRQAQYSSTSAPFGYWQEENP